MANLICITGYVENADCGHCNRPLRHGIITDAGIVGATCFARKLTAPKLLRGKAYRPGADEVVYIARRAHNPARYSLSDWHLNWERAA